MLKVALVFGISGACRRDKLTKMTIDDIEDNGTILIVKIPNTKTAVQRTFIVSNGGERDLDYLSFYRKYVALRPLNSTTRRFFLKCENDKCTNRIVGIGNMLKYIAEYLNLPDSAFYTGHCFRRSSATLLADSGTDITCLKRHGGWKSTAVAEGYIEESLENKALLSHKILGKKQQPDIISNNHSVTSTLASNKIDSGIKIVKTIQ